MDEGETADRETINPTHKMTVVSIGDAQILRLMLVT
jgi:hypothetical protein